MTGAAIIHGIPNNGSPISLSYIATFILERLEAEHMFEQYKVKDSIGNDASAVGFNERMELTIDLTPSAATQAAAALLVTVPAMLNTVTIANVKANGVFGVLQAQQIFNGTYLYDKGGSRILMQSGQAAKITGMKVVKYSDTTQNTSMTTQVVG